MTFVLGGLRRSKQFAKKRTYAEKKRSRPSGSVPPAPMISPRTRTSSEVMQPGTSSSSSSLPSGGQAKRGGGLRVHLVLSPVRLPLLPLDLGPARGVELSLASCLVRAFVSLVPLGAGRGRLLVRSGRPLSTPLPRLPLPAHHSKLCDVVSRESLRRSAPVLDPSVFPDLRIEERRKIAEPALGQTAVVTGPVVPALALLTARCQAVESVGGGPRLDRCPPVSGRSLRTAPDHIAFVLALGETGHDPQIATALDVTGRGLRTATDRVNSVRDPLPPGRSS